MYTSHNIETGRMGLRAGYEPIGVGEVPSRVCGGWRTWSHEKRAIIVGATSLLLTVLLGAGYATVHVIVHQKIKDVSEIK
jgi:hypothetical protein